LSDDIGSEKKRRGEEIENRRKELNKLENLFVLAER